MAITVRNVSKTFADFTALSSVDLDVPAGSLTALLGPSGSGKSTLLRIIAGLETPDAGEVFISGTDKTGVPAHRRDVGFVFQHYAAFKHMTVAKNIAFGLEIRKRPKAEIRARVSELIRLVQLDGFGDRYPSQLSGGQRQRMALARALAVEPEVLLLDEPFGALDARVRSELRAWLRRLHDEMDVTTVFVTHDQEEAMEVADTIVVMNHGRIEQKGDPQDVYDNPATEFVMRFMGQVNELEGAYVRPHDVELRLEPNGTTSPAVVERVLRLGRQVRVELAGEDGASLSAEVTREEADRLGLETGARVHVRPSRERRFDGEAVTAGGAGVSP
jgi:sulfate/thiosulfate transport system ATP-binding protein